MNDRNSKPKLEPLEWRHAHDLQRVVNDPTMTEWSNMPHVYFSNGAQSLIQRSLHQARNEGNHMLALYIEDDLSGVLVFSEIRWYRKQDIFSFGSKPTVGNPGGRSPIWRM